MERELLLMRHGKSDWSFAVPDEERPLKKRGRRDSRRMGRWLGGQGLCPELVLSSPARRARDTAALVVSECGLAEAALRIEPVLYQGSDPEVLLLLRSVRDEVRRLLVVGHNPTMDDLVLLLGGRSALAYDDGKLMVTAAVARFRIIGSWAELLEGERELIGIVRPRWLGERFS